ncbi:MAG: hypothetical protein ACPG6B_09775, partial [Oceanihabitans sp.]
MKIKHNELEKSIEIKDSLKQHYFFLKILMLLNLISAIANLHDINKTGIEFVEMIFIAIGIVSLFALYLLIFKKS